MTEEEKYWEKTLGHMCMSLGQAWELERKIFLEEDAAGLDLETLLLNTKQSVLTALRKATDRKSGGKGYPTEYNLWRKVTSAQVLGIGGDHLEEHFGEEDPYGKWEQGLADLRTLGDKVVAHSNPEGLLQKNEDGENIEEKQTGRAISSEASFGKTSMHTMVGVCKGALNAAEETFPNLKGRLHRHCLPKFKSEEEVGPIAEALKKRFKKNLRVFFLRGETFKYKFLGEEEAPQEWRELFGKRDGRGFIFYDDPGVRKLLAEQVED